MRFIGFNGRFKKRTSKKLKRKRFEVNSLRESNLLHFEISVKT
ncbi:hypothetical protein LEP1GSC052_1780 [Leptospira kmetyi serovar Malaysia str. Bejo-Iso9]|nr:hypothetical protein LEP1GSC052_1780 [Leptospira kmetyi serovar Malaysia str. Bejo-Iso9]